MKLLATLPIFCLLALASALDSPQRCTSPDQIEGMVSVFLPLQFTGDYGMFSYDAINKRFYSHFFLSKGEQTWQQVDILLFEKSVMYLYFPQNKTCLKAPLHAPFQKFGVPKNATLLGPSSIGTLQVPGAGLLCNTWNGIEYGVYYITSFTDYDCFPIYRVNVFGKFWYSETYMNITAGIRDPTVFTPPPECDDPVYEPSLSERLHPWVAISVSGVNASGVDQFLDILRIGGNL
ncbi:mammalian ependymin-related protein 1-like [Hypanus sabinus]|uniref:mammalian ependymin-related protein 1-like n=1 Tax=Hypanus sabinus TaxID=79690 RepID=UPI0028C4C609|nr:mammalian ependymin-related protein 1-like [Hypanus sabinus]